MRLLLDPENDFGMVYCEITRYHCDRERVVVPSRNISFDYKQGLMFKTLLLLFTLQYGQFFPQKIILSQRCNHFPHNVCLCVKPIPIPHVHTIGRIICFYQRLR